MDCAQGRRAGQARAADGQQAASGQQAAGGNGAPAASEALAATMAMAARLAAQNARLTAQAGSQLHWQRAAAEVTQRLLFADEPHDVLELIAQHARDISGADLMVISLPTPSGEHLSIETAVGAGADGALGLVFPLRTAMSRFVFASGKPMAVRDFSSDERVARLPQRMIPLGPAVIFPLGLPGEVRGVMTAGQKIGAPPLAQPVVEMLSTFAVQAGIGLRLAGLRHDAERAALLADRDRIARDLHDLVIQRLFATGMSLHGALPLLEPGTAADRVRRAVDDLDETIRDIRSAIFTLVPGDRQDAPLLRARIVSVAEEMSGPLGFAPWLRIDGALDARVPRQASDDLLAALREGLANVARHARASEADVTVTAGRDLLLAVRDNGRGIRKGGRRSGLANLARRAAGLGGALAVTPADGGGTLLSWRVPLDGSAPRLSHPGHPARPRTPPPSPGPGSGQLPPASRPPPRAGPHARGPAALPAGPRSPASPPAARSCPVPGWPRSPGCPARPPGRRSAPPAACRPARPGPPPWRTARARPGTAPSPAPPCRA